MKYNKPHCHFCGQTKSVKYAMRVKDDKDNVKTVACCNRCALKSLVFHKEEKVDEQREAD